MKKNRPVIDKLDGANGLWQTGGAVWERAGGAARAWICPAGRVLAVLSDSRQASDFISDLRGLFPDRPAFLLNDLPLTSRSLGSRPLLLERGETLRQWAAEKEGVLAATPGALMAPCLLGGTELLVKKGDSMSPGRLAEWLQSSGYQKTDLVWSPGQYVQRGFIMDIFDPGHVLPIRLEFFDEILERVRTFHPSTQKSDTELESVTLHSMSEAKNAAPVSLLPVDTQVLLFEPHKIEGQAVSFHWLWQELCGEAGVSTVPDWNETFNSLARFPHLRLVSSPENADAELNIEGLVPFRGDVGAALRLCRELMEQGCRVSVRSSNPRFLDRKNGPFAGLKSRSKDLKRELKIKKGVLTSGFIDHAAGQAFISDRELSGVSTSGAVSEWRAPLEWRERLSTGQLVIHEDYGMGVFRGVEEVVSAGSNMDALVIEFAEGQRLLVPVLQSHRLTPLAEHENEATQLDSLHGTRWRRSVAKDRERAKEEAKILIELFARRELERREPWDEPGELYDEFVRAFPHVETSDQLRAVSEIMADLSRPFPMDRLLVGDVGFGKTEVALRAAFRAVTSGHQVCFLVPTTILAQQHYATFQARLAGFPVSVGLLSRFVSKKGLTDTLRRAGDGTLDILIGTHKLLQKGVSFKNLGLLVIDEEHRFGVMHKEALKRVYGSVDILSLSATPIPRTLAMALRGIRGISMLSTPPEDRLPVTTFAGPWQTQVVRRAIAYELNRGGQVYFLAGRISRMDAHFQMLSAFFPDARIRIAHGRMNEKELESTMMDFYSGRTDILIVTTIIESGLDVGRANTIIIDDSQELGLAQMYQLRGRVGRRGENAFAYFFYPEKAVLKRETADRLEAISTMTDLGSGYAIARRDLDIRGGGEIGGTSQHGGVHSGSFHLFYRMLEQELARLRGEKLKLTELVFDQGGSVPVSYIPQEEVRVTLYRRLLQVVGLDELKALMDEVRDRFGEPPVETRLLEALTAIRSFGGYFGLEKVSLKNGRAAVAGDLTELGSCLRRAQGWTVLGSHAEGPGGAEGAITVLEAMRTCQAAALKANLYK